MIRLATLLSIAMIALGQVPEPPAYVRIETTAAGNLKATLTVARMPAGLPEAFAHAMGCDIPGLEKSPYESIISVQCPGTRPSGLTFHAAIRPAELTPLLRQAGFGSLDLFLTNAHFPSLRFDPFIPPRGRGSKYYQTQYSLDQIPQQITIDGGFEISQVQLLAACALGLILAPFLLLLPRPSDPLRLRVRTEGLFVLGWICWIWMLARVGAGALLSYLFGHWAMAPLPALMAPPLAAVWIGARLAGAQYARLIPNGPGADYYRHTLFWTGAAATCIVSTMLGAMLSPSTNALGSVLVGLVLAIACLTRLRRTARGGRHALSQGDLHKRMFELAAKAGVNLRRVSILTSPAPRPPAAFATRWGVIMLNEGLLRNLSRREVDAIVCHELSHIGPLKRSTLVLPYLLIVASVLGSAWIPNFVDLIPVLLLAVYFWIKAWRRAGERKADFNSVRWSSDPEAMITGLARVSYANGVPLEWAPPVSWMMAHPSIMDRIRGIARAGGVSGLRIAELLEESRRDPADHYEEAPHEKAPAVVVPDEAAFSPVMRKRLQMRLTWYMLLAPIVFGLPSVWLLERTELPWWAVITAGTLCSMLAMSVGLEWVVGSVREKVKQRAIARHGQGAFAGISPAAEPRLFDGIYHYDLGMVRFVDEALEFAGDRARFRLDRRLTRRVWLGDGARHWTARQVVYIECQPSPEAEPVIFSLQSFEAWFWPSTVRMAKRLHRQVDAWHKAPPSSSTPPQLCALPQVEGRSPAFISFRTAYRSIGIYCGTAFFLASLGTWFFGSRASWDPSAMLCPVAVCGALALFMVAPRMRWDRLKTRLVSSRRLFVE